MTARDRIEATLRRLVDASTFERILLSVAALGASIVVGAVILLVSGYVAACEEPFLVLGGASFCYNPVRVYGALVMGAFGNPFNVALTLQGTAILVLAGLAVAVSFRTGIFNIGTQGQMLLGGLATALSVVWIAPHVPDGIVGGLILIPAGTLVGAAVGGLYGALPGALKAYADANEVITTIMLNFIAANVAFFLVSGYFQDPQSQSVETKPIPSYALLEPVLPSIRESGASFSMLVLAFALVLVVLVYYLLFQTSLGYDLRTAGTQPEAAEYGGIEAKRVVVQAMTLSGAIGGVAGSMWVLMIMGRWRTAMPSFGFDGITVSILAGNHPIGVALAGLLFGALRSGSQFIDFQLGVPKQLVGVLRGLIILFVAMPEFFRMLGKRYVVRERRTVATDGGEGGGDDDA
jgi:simple sugar transport system permease protein